MRTHILRPRLLRLRATIMAHVLSAATVWAGAAQLPIGFTDTPLAQSLDQPVAIALVPDAAPQAPRVVFVEQKSAGVHVLVGTTVREVGTIPDVATAGGERGLLGVAVDPGFPGAPYLYVHATDSRAGGQIVISRFTLSGDLAFTGSGDLDLVAGSRYDLVTGLPDNNSNHNGGTVRFGPDGRLYASLGDDAVSCAAQSLTIPAGKILRLDTSRLPASGSGPAPFAILTPPDNPFATHADSLARLVYVLGLRNPFRFHVDAATGALFVADVGRSEWEEYNRFTTGGANGGWPWREGPDTYTTCGGQAPSTVEPIAWYGHGEGAAIVSAGIYRRPASGANRWPPEYDGDAFFIDYYSGFMRRISSQGANWVIPPPVAGQPSSNDWAMGMNAVSDVLAMPDGSLLYVRQAIDYAPFTGEIRRIAFPQTTGVPGAVPEGIALAAPRPAPSQGPVVLAWSQPERAAVRLVIHDVAGRNVQTVVDAVHEPGSHEGVWNGRREDGGVVPPGVYLVRLEVGGTQRSARITMLR